MAEGRWSGRSIDSGNRIMIPAAKLRERGFPKKFAVLVQVNQYRIIICSRSYWKKIIREDPSFEERPHWYVEIDGGGRVLLPSEIRSQLDRVVTMIATYKCLEIPTSKETRKQSLLSAFAELNREAQKVLAIPGAENLDSLKILQDKLRELQGLVNAHLDSYQRIRDSVN